jgi:hypothetical protein
MKLYDVIKSLPPYEANDPVHFYLNFFSDKFGNPQDIQYVLKLKDEFKPYISLN